MRNFFRKTIVLGLFFLPVAAQAATAIYSTFFSYTEDVALVMEFVAPLVVATAVLVLFWGLAKFILAAGDVKEIADGRRLMIWGVIAMTVMVSTVGLTRMLEQALGIEGPFPLPCQTAGNALPDSGIECGPNVGSTFINLVEGDIVPLLIRILRLLVGVALVAFFVGIVRFMYALSAGDEKSLATGKQLMVWGIIALMVMFSWFAIIRLFSQAFGFGTVGIDGIVPHLEFK